MEHEEIIAKENILNATTGRAKFWHKAIAEEHQKSCKRFLEFLKKYEGLGDYKEFQDMDEMMRDKISDLKQAIKLYDEVPISDVSRNGGEEWKIV